MNRILTALTAVLILLSILSHTGSGNPEGNPVIHDYQLTGAKGTAWQKIRDQWMDNTYRTCLKKFRLKLSCGGCVYIYMKAVIRIGPEGRLSEYRNTGSSVCGKKIPRHVENCFMENFRDMDFPDELKNSEFESMLGTGLKC